MSNEDELNLLTVVKTYNQEILNILEEAELHIRNTRAEVRETGRALDRIRENMLK